ncbi:four helix bundle suffix domain-containing protein [Roseibacillus ishigakijimensis]|uniref:Four helix bundle protein n=1 Tax=Roseibacillus ishigakijimensis TaxID=454146 RepID=A0A934RRC8_9BACT|nr:four helix bundle suffix domain-containing protein [Roseibacillus ishigakijimensis]MBK1835540.1 four helix bundle protein [Roseibacillus ishigakijimensis]
MKKKKLRPSGGYRKLASFQTSTLIYDATVSFCKAFIDPYSRTTDQMVQAARSGRQNIAEGNRAASTSTHSELKLTNVARASLEELLLDFEDYLRQNALPLWEKDDPRASGVRALAQQCQRRDRSDRTDPTDPSALHLASPDDKGDRARYALYRSHLEHEDPAHRANAVICLIHQANYLLDQQLIAMEQAFLEEGGYKEQLFAERIARRANKPDRPDPSDRQDLKNPSCPDCDKPMAVRTARAGANQGSQFWGCTGYPDCKKTLPI